MGAQRDFTHTTHTGVFVVPILPCALVVITQFCFQLRVHSLKKFSGNNTISRMLQEVALLQALQRLKKL